MADLKDVEIAFTKIVAGWLGKTFPAASSTDDIFRNQIPEKKGEGVAVIFNTRIENNDPHIPHFNVQIVAKYISRDDCLGILDLLRENVPAYGPTQDSIQFPTILQRGGAGVLPLGGVGSQDAGRKKYHMFFNLRVRFKD